MTYKKMIHYSGLALLSLTLITITSAGEVMAQDQQTNANTITNVIGNESNLSTLEQAIEASSLENTLNNPDATYTIFAPTNQAFDILPQSALDTLLDPANQDTLDDLLQYHVLGSRVPSGDVPDQSRMLPTLAENEIEIGLVDGNVQITDEQGNQYQVVTADINADNGVVHIIDGVLLNNQLNLVEGDNTQNNITQDNNTQNTDEENTTTVEETEDTQESTTKGGEDLEDTGLRVFLPIVLGIGFIAIATKLHKTI